ncbi:Ig-like domain-containing protein [Cellulomonas denverensis]|uniref:Ig-like domain-containing protein n=1 Tax=Cellulomonas denverensis TaxID=264297 RepID=UPI0035EFAB9B
MSVPTGSVRRTPWCSRPAGSPDLSAEGGSHLSATTGTRIADGNTPHTVSATLVDQYGNPVPDIEVDFALAEGLAVAAGGSTTVSTNESGVAALDVVSSTAGTYDVTASVGGVQIVNGSPATVAFSAGVVDMSQSSFTISPEGPLAAGSGAESTYTGVVQARDAGGNPVSGVTVVITAEPTVAEQPLVGTTDADGRMAVDFTSTVAQTSRLTAYLTVNGTAQPLPGSQPHVDRRCPGPDRGRQVDSVGHLGQSARRWGGRSHPDCHRA